MKISTQAGGSSTASDLIKKPLIGLILGLAATAVICSASIGPDVYVDSCNIITHKDGKQLSSINICKEGL